MEAGHNITARRIKEVDGLRGIAILLVVSFHYLNNQLTDNSDKVSNILSGASGFGWVGVDLFFVLSGFLIGSVLIFNKGAGNYFRVFYLRRILRIIPNYFLLLILFGIICNIRYFSGNYFLSLQNDIPYWSYFGMVHNFFMAYHDTFGNRALSITWSIGIEEQFYLIFPFLVFFISERYLPYLLVVFVAGSVIIRSMFNTWMPQYVLLPSRLDGLSIGFLIAYFHQNDMLVKYKKQVSNFFTGAIPVIIACSAFLYIRLGDLGPIKHTFFSIVFAATLIFALLYKNTWYGGFLRNRILSWIGVISYSLYLFHFLILGLCNHVAGKTGIGIKNGNDVIITLAAFAISLSFSWIVYTTLEKPMVRLGKKVKYQWAR